MKIFEIVSPWISHQKAARAYRRGMRRWGVEFTGAVGHADVTLIHGSPPVFERITSSMRPGDPPVVAYTTWETTKTPPEMEQWLAGCSVVLTPSEFCKRALEQRHGNVHVVPHAIERLPTGDAERTTVRHKIRKDSRFTFLTVTDMRNPRKNVQGVLAAFAKLNVRHPGQFRLIIKEYGAGAAEVRQAGVTIMSDKLTDLEMSALYSVCDCYVSLHHSEGWGLPITEAMAAGIPVIATGYSGNMEYMTADNSVPIPYKESFIKIEVGSPWSKYYGNDSKWALPDIHAASSAMENGRAIKDSEAAHFAREETVRRFSVKEVSRRMIEVLLKAAR